MSKKLLGRASSIGLVFASAVWSFSYQARESATGGGFEVASIKSCPDTENGSGRVDSSPGRLTLECVPLAEMIRDAYLAYPRGRPWPVLGGIPLPPVPYFELRQPLKGAPSWVESKRFTINAKAAGPVSAEMMRGPMMGRLLANRFQLRIRIEPHEVAVYEVFAARGGPKIATASPGKCTKQDSVAKSSAPGGTPGGPRNICGGLSVSSHGGLDGFGITIDAMLLRFSLALGRDVINKTGLEGEYDVHLDLTFADLRPARRGPPGAAVNTDNLELDAESAIPRALHKLGLGLRPGKRVGNQIVIDHVEFPAAN